MAKKKKVGAANPWDTPAKKLQEVAKNISSEVEQTKPAPKKPAATTESLAVIRVSRSFHKRAKKAAVDADISIREFIERLIDENVPK